MKMFRKPKIGLLGLIIDGYEPIFPGIISRQEEYAKKVAESLSDIADVCFFGAATDRNAVEAQFARFNNEGVDGVLIVLLAYCRSTWLIHALRNNHLPLALAVLQPDEEMKPSFTELDFTVNQGIHGAQDNANMMNRLGYSCQYFAGSRLGERFKKFFSDFSKAACVYSRLHRSRVALIGKMEGMGDLYVDEIALHSRIGPEFCYESIGSVQHYMDCFSDKEVKTCIESYRDIFDIDSSMSESSLIHAARQYLSLKQLLEQGCYDAFTLHFEVMSADGRFEFLPFLAASNLMADGYGYAAEGDAMCAAALSMAMEMTNRRATFSEMYAMDFKEQALLLCHAGEGNYAIAHTLAKPRLLNKVFNEGGLSNPPTPYFTPEPGRATIVSFAPGIGDRFRFVVSSGEILARHDLGGCEMPYMFFRPDCGMERCVEGWLCNGGTHHEVITLGDTVGLWKMIASMSGIDCVLL